MKYYYGNSYKEALSNNPVEIPTTDILEAYKENYNVVIPVNEAENLPTEVDIKIDNEELADDLHCGNVEDVEEYINDYLSDEYSYCVNSYKWDVDGDVINVTQIDWDTSE